MFVQFLNMNYVIKAQRRFDNDVKKASKKSFLESLFFEPKSKMFFGLDVGIRNLEVLDNILASMLGVMGRSWGRLGAC